MSVGSSNPWAARYASLLDREMLKQRAIVTVPSIEGLQSMPIETACKTLERGLKTVFYPTNQCLDILYRFVGMAHAHCLEKYPSPKDFLAGIYAEEAPLQEFSPPICFTGLPGTGKTKILKALNRILDFETHLTFDDHSPFRLRGPWYVTVKAKNTPNDIFRSLVHVNGSLADLIKKSRRNAYRDGVSFLFADEFQFATGSGQANTRVSQMLLSLAYLGLPFIFAANFSLCYRLLKRPKEERDRLLSKVIVLLPDHPESDDWLDTLRALQAVAPEILVFEVEKDAADLHRWSAGLKRALVELIMIAFRDVHPRGGKIDRSALKRAYESMDFAQHRNDVEILATQAIQNRPGTKSKDLWCPFPLPKETAESFTELAKGQRDQKFAEAELEASMNAEERKALQAFEKTQKKGEKTGGTVTPIKRKPVPTAEDLKNNANWFKDLL